MTRPSPLALSLAALVALAPAAAAQSSAPLRLASATPPSSLADYAGLYATDGGMIEVRDGADGLVLVAHGAPVAARLAPLAASDAATDARAERLLDAWITGDLDTVVGAVRPARQAAAAEAVAAYRGALVRGHGDVVAGSVIGTFRQIDGREATLVQVLFDRGAEWAAFVWDEDGALVTVTRGLSPVLVTAVRATGADTFAASAETAPLAFEREADGRIGALHMGTFSAVR